MSDLRKIIIRGKEEDPHVYNIYIEDGEDIFDISAQVHRVKIELEAGQRVAKVELEFIGLVDFEGFTDDITISKGDDFRERLSEKGNGT